MRSTGPSTLFLDFIPLTLQNLDVSIIKTAFKNRKSAYGICVFNINFTLQRVHFPTQYTPNGILMVADCVLCAFRALSLYIM